MANTVKNKKIAPLRIALIAVLALVLALGAAKFLLDRGGAPASTAKLGNAGGNLANGGLALESGGSVYLADPASGLLAQVSAGETSGAAVGATAGAYFNTDGSALWYVDRATGALMRSDLKGGAPTEVVPGPVTRLTLADGYLYYIDVASNYALNRVPVEGGAAELLSAARVMQYAIVGERIFYRDLNGDDCLCYMGLDGSGAATLSPRAGQVLFSQGPRLYFSDPARQGALSYCELGGDGNFYGPKELDTGTVTCAVADDGALYYAKAEDGKLYRLDLSLALDGDPQAESLLADLPVYGLQDAGGYIYYRSVTDGGLWGAVAKR